MSLSRALDQLRFSLYLVGKDNVIASKKFAKLHLFSIKIRYTLFFKLSKENIEIEKSRTSTTLLSYQYLVLVISIKTYFEAFFLLDTLKNDFALNDIMMDALSQTFKQTRNQLTKDVRYLKVMKPKSTTALNEDIVFG